MAIYKVHHLTLTAPRAQLTDTQTENYLKIIMGMSADTEAAAANVIKFSRTARFLYKCAYEEVATVKVPDERTLLQAQNIVFTHTNSVEHSWTINADVEAIHLALRSTSVGDIIESPDGEMFLVMPVGFASLSALLKEEVIQNEQ